MDQVYQLVDEAAHELLLKLLAQAQTLGELTTEIDTTLLADTLFSLAQHSIGRLMTQPEIDHHQALAQLTAQVTLLVSPYLVLSPVTFSSSGGSRIVSPQESDKHP